MEAVQLRARLREHVVGLKDLVTHGKLADVCRELGLPEPPPSGPEVSKGARLPKPSAWRANAEPRGARDGRCGDSRVGSPSRADSWLRAAIATDQVRAAMLSGDGAHWRSQVLLIPLHLARRRAH